MKQKELMDWYIMVMLLSAKLGLGINVQARKMQILLGHHLEIMTMPIKKEQLAARIDQIQSVICNSTQAAGQASALNSK
jgi:hypothetical protein